MQRDLPCRVSVRIRGRLPFWAGGRLPPGVRLCRAQGRALPPNSKQAVPRRILCQWWRVFPGTLAGAFPNSVSPRPSPRPSRPRRVIVSTQHRRAPNASGCEDQAPDARELRPRRQASPASAHPRGRGRRPCAPDAEKPCSGPFPRRIAPYKTASSASGDAAASTAKRSQERTSISADTSRRSSTSPAPPLRTSRRSSLA